MDETEIDRSASSRVEDSVDHDDAEGSEGEGQEDQSGSHEDEHGEEASREEDQMEASDHEEGEEQQEQSEEGDVGEQEDEGSEGAEAESQEEAEVSEEGDAESEEFEPEEEPGEGDHAEEGEREEDGEEDAAGEEEIIEEEEYEEEYEGPYEEEEVVEEVDGAEEQAYEDEVIEENALSDVDEEAPEGSEGAASEDVPDEEEGEEIENLAEDDLENELAPVDVDEFEDEEGNVYEDVVMEDKDGEDIEDRAAASGATVTDDRDLELGQTEKTASKDDRSELVDFFTPTWGKFFCVVLVAALIAVGVILGIVLSDDDSSSDKSAPVSPTPSAPSPPSAGGTPAPAAGTRAPSTSIPTLSPTILPPNFPLPVERIQDLVNPNGSQSFGSSVSISSDWIGVGDSEDESGAGSVSTYQVAGSQWLLVEKLTGAPNSAFGTSIDFPSVSGANTMVVGAPKLPVSDTISIPVGGVYFYSFNQADGLWGQEGSTITPGQDVTGANALFGSSVAMSDNNRVVIGAPGHNAGGVRAGRVYVFEAQGGTSDWAQMADQELLGQARDAMLGTAVDISADGTLIAAGEPGSDSFSIYSWTGSMWNLETRPTLANNTHAGSSIKILSPSYVAVGAPGANGGAGFVHVFQKTNGVWAEVAGVGGKSTDSIGSSGTIDGLVGTTGPRLVVGTSGGVVRRYDFVDNMWVERYEFDTTFPITSVSIIQGSVGDDEVLIGNGNNGAVTLIDRLMTPAPTRAPTAPPVPSPTHAPTGSQPSSPGSVWQPLGSPITVTTAPLGSAVAVSSSFLAAGLPDGIGGAGGVQTYDRPSSEWSRLQAIFDTQARGFGSSVDLSEGSNTILVVGAPDTAPFTSTTSTPFGAAYAYERSGGNWNLLGSRLLPLNDLPQGNGRFGDSVAVSSAAMRLVVGAPRGSLNFTALDTGRLFAYDFVGTNWMPIANPIIGPPGSFLGTSVDITPDGLRVLIGGPGTGRGGDGGGYVAYYEWNASQSAWNEIFKLNGSNNENLGTSVKILSDSGDLIAVGASAFGDSQGVVRVYAETELNGQVSFALQGSELVGATGEKIGQSLAGSSGVVMFGTSLGSVRVYRFNGSDWTLVGQEIAVGSEVLSLATSGTADSVVVGAADGAVRTYVLV